MILQDIPILHNMEHIERDISQGQQPIGLRQECREPIGPILLQVLKEGAVTQHVRNRVHYPKRKPLKERLPSLPGYVPNRLPVPSIHRCSVWLELASAPDHELEVALLGEG